MISTEYHEWDFYSTMLDYKTFKIKNCNNLSEYKSQKMYDSTSVVK